MPNSFLTLLRKQFSGVETVFLQVVLVQKDTYRQKNPTKPWLKSQTLYEN